LFAGGGGDTEGAEKAGYTTLWCVEYDKYACAVLRKRFSASIIEQDITTITDDYIKSLPVPDVLTFGSPCVGLSTAGMRQGFKDPRSALFFEGIRFLKIIQPKMFIFENVKGLLSSSGGDDFKAAIAAFAEVGYVGTWQLRNGNRHVPQNRERIFCVGIHRRYSHITTDAKQAIAL
jgi:DNA (cytosine-5)-methyltransferase 1